MPHTSKELRWSLLVFIELMLIKLFKNSSNRPGTWLAEFPACPASKEGHSPPATLRNRNVFWEPQNESCSATSVGPGGEDGWRVSGWASQPWEAFM